ncbi:hypothetical protein BGX26_005433, partial [Mortierella sp. AD094]
MAVLRLISQHTNTPLESATVILVIDGLQSFIDGPNDGQNRDSKFYRALTNIADLALGDVFLITCCTATVSTPVDRALAFTHRKRVVLPVASLNPPFILQSGTRVLVFDMDDHITKVLMGDCGGRGRALESLQETLVQLGGIDAC